MVSFFLKNITLLSKFPNLILGQAEVQRSTTEKQLKAPEWLFQKRQRISFAMEKKSLRKFHLKKTP